MLKRRLSTLRATTVVALAAVLAAAIAVTPSFAGSPFLTNKKAAHLYVSNKKAPTLYLKKKAAGNIFVKKADAPLTPVVGIAAGHRRLRPSTATTPGYIPTAFTSFGTARHRLRGDHVLRLGDVHSGETDADLACPIQILVDGQTTGKVNFAPATASSPAPVPLVHTVMQTTVLQKGGHTVAVQYAGAKNVVFTLKGWNLAVQAYPAAPGSRPEASK